MSTTHVSELKGDWTVARMTLLESEIQKLKAENTRLISERDSALEDLEKAEQRLEEFESTTDKLPEPEFELVGDEGYNEIIADLEYRIAGWEKKYKELDDKHRQMMRDASYVFAQHAGAVWLLLNELNLDLEPEFTQRDLLYLLDRLLRKEYYID